MLKLTHLLPEYTPAYRFFIKNHPQALLYHTPAWWEVLRRSYGYQPVPLIAIENEQVVGVLPLMRVHGWVKGSRLVSLPFSHVVPILTTHPEIEIVLLDAAIEMTQNYAYLEIRSPIQHEKFQSVVSNYISELDITPPIEEIFDSFSKSNRRSIRAAERANFTFREGCTAEDFQSFYRLEVETRHRQGAPMYPPGYFRNLHELSGERVKAYFLQLNGRDVAGTIIFRDGKRASYAYASSVSDPEIKRLNPNNLLLWETIKSCKAAGTEIFDFGTTPIHHETLLTFKNRFSPITREIPYFYYLNTRESLPVIKRDSISVQMVQKLFKIMPPVLFRRLSPFLLREVG